MKEWKKPMLIVLYRAQPEESILKGCKTKGAPFGPERVNNKCDMVKGAGVPCGACHPESGSLS